MKPVIHDFHDLSDSREMLERKGNPFPYLLIYLLLTIIIGTLIWTYFGEMDEVVKATGVVRPNDQVSTIMTKTTASAKEVFLKPGQKVKKGDRLLVLEHEDLLIQKEALLREKENAAREKRMLERMAKSVREGKNDFSPKEESYFREYEKYRSDYDKLRLELMQQKRELEKAKMQVQKTRMDQEVNDADFTKQANDLQAELAQLKKLKEAVLSGKNAFTEAESPYIQRYIDYEAKKKRLEETAEERKAQWERSKALGEEYVPKVEMEQQQKAWEQAVRAVGDMQNETILQIQSEVAEREKNLQALTFNMKRASDPTLSQMEGLLGMQLKESGSYMETMLNKLRTEKLVEINARIKALEEKERGTEEELKNVEVALQDRTITAPISGTVNLLNEVSAGDIVPAGKEIARIIPESGSEYKVVLSVENKDISAMKVGNKIKYHFLALPYTEYGEIAGRVERVSTDAMVHPETGTSYYVVEASIENKPLVSFKGEAASVKVGMVSEAYVVTESKKILFYLLEKLDLKE